MFITSTPGVGSLQSTSGGHDRLLCLRRESSIWLTRYSRCSLAEFDASIWIILFSRRDIFREKAQVSFFHITSQCLLQQTTINDDCLGTCSKHLKSCSGFLGRWEKSHFQIHRKITLFIFSFWFLFRLFCF